MADPTQFMQPRANPLANYFRQPKIYVRLPSQGLFYPPGALDVSANGEYAVYAMTAKDELMFKTPDALMNGQATVEVIKSCIPAIKDPWHMPSIDMDAALVAIRIATYGEEMDVTASCPKCNEFNDYNFDLLRFLEFLGQFEFRSQLQVGPLVVTIRPYNYREVTRSALQSFEQQRILDIVQDEKLSEEEKIAQFGQSFIKLTELTVEVISGCITAIDTPEGTVTDAAMIKEFMQNADKAVFNAVADHVAAMKNEIELKVHNVTCTSCSHEFNISVTMDQANFFAVRS